MRFWQLLSVADRTSISDVAARHSDWTSYGAWTADFASICDSQDRAKLDHILPHALVREVLAGESKRLFLSGDHLRSYRHTASDLELSMLEAFDRFGGVAVEESVEKGSFSVRGLSGGDHQ